MPRNVFLDRKAKIFKVIMLILRKHDHLLFAIRISDAAKANISTSISGLELVSSACFTYIAD